MCMTVLLMINLQDTDHQPAGVCLWSQNLDPDTQCGACYNHALCFASISVLSQLWYDRVMLAQGSKHIFVVSSHSFRHIKGKQYCIEWCSTTLPLFSQNPASYHHDDDSNDVADAEVSGYQGVNKSVEPAIQVRERDFCRHLDVNKRRVAFRGGSRILQYPKIYSQYPKM